MKPAHLIAMASLTACLFLFTSFKTPGQRDLLSNSIVEKTVVFKVTYDAAADKLSATEKMDVSRMLVERNTEGKVVSVSKEAIVSEMRMSARSINSLVNAKGIMKGDTYALVSFRQDASSDKASALPSDDELLEFLKESFRSSARNSFRGSDFSVSDRGWNCSGGSCSSRVPEGVDVFVWEE